LKKLRVDWEKILEDPTMASLFHNQATNNLRALKVAGETISFKKLSASIVKAAALTVLPDKEKRSGWFAENEEEILGLTEIMNRAGEQMRTNKTHEVILTYREARTNMRKCKRRAQSRWTESQGLKIEKVKGAYPRRFWKQKSVLQTGLTGHHVKRTTKRFAEGDGAEAMNDVDDIEILSKHFTKVYNRDLTFDPQVLKKLRKRKIVQDFAQPPPTRDELIEAIKKMNLLAATGESGLSPTAMKNLSKEHKDELLTIIQRYWNGTDTNPEWNTSILRWIYTGKELQSKQLQSHLPARCNG
jgi:hypothetical protein